MLEYEEEDYFENKKFNSDAETWKDIENEK